jgi:hypothetical protein
MKSINSPGETRKQKEEAWREMLLMKTCLCLIPFVPGELKERNLTVFLTILSVQTNSLPQWLNCRSFNPCLFSSIL